MFVKSKQFESNLKLYFYDKELSAKGSNNESVVLPVLDCLDNPKVVTPHTKIYSMSKKNIFVTSNTVCIAVTPAQKKLLELITPVESITYSQSLKIVHENALYNLIEGMEDLQASFSTQLLLDAIQEIANETFINNLKAS